MILLIAIIVQIYITYICKASIFRRDYFKCKHYQSCQNYACVDVLMSLTTWYESSISNESSISLPGSLIRCHKHVIKCVTCGVLYPRASERSKHMRLYNNSNQIPMCDNCINMIRSSLNILSLLGIRGLIDPIPREIRKFIALNVIISLGKDVHESNDSYKF